MSAAPPLIWLPLILGCALLVATREILAKHALRAVDPLVAAWSGGVCLPVAGVALWMAGLPPIPASAWSLLAASAVVNAAAIVWYLQAIEQGDLSVVAPLPALSLVLLILAGPIVAGDRLSAGGVAGVLLIMAGAWLACRSRAPRGPTAGAAAGLARRGPAAFWRAPGVRPMLLATAAMAGSSLLDGLGTRRTSAAFWTFAAQAGIVLLLTPFALRRMTRRPATWHALRAVGPVVIAAGLLIGVAAMLQGWALATGAPVAYVLAGKRTSILLSVCWGVFVLGEGRAAPASAEGASAAIVSSVSVRRVGGALLVVTGVVCLALLRG